MVDASAGGGGILCLNIVHTGLASLDLPGDPLGIRSQLW